MWWEKEERAGRRNQKWGGRKPFGLAQVYSAVLVRQRSVAVRLKDGVVAPSPRSAGHTSKLAAGEGGGLGGTWAGLSSNFGVAAVALPPLTPSTPSAHRVPAFFAREQLSTPADRPHKPSSGHPSLATWLDSACPLTRASRPRAVIGSWGRLEKTRFRRLKMN